VRRTDKKVGVSGSFQNL